MHLRILHSNLTQEATCAGQWRPVKLAYIQVLADGAETPSYSHVTSRAAGFANFACFEPHQKVIIIHIQVQLHCFKCVCEFVYIGGGTYVYYIYIQYIHIYIYIHVYIHMNIYIYMCVCDK